jgi:hypothetical protein
MAKHFEMQDIRSCKRRRVTIITSHDEVVNGVIMEPDSETLTCVLNAPMEATRVESGLRVQLKLDQRVVVPPSPTLCCRWLGHAKREIKGDRRFIDFPTSWR